VDRVQQLASLLSSAGKDNLRTLSFRGIIDLPQQSRYAFIFNFPSKAADVEPISLHALMDSTAGSASRLTLPQRFRVAQDVTRAISAFHVDGWVHKSIRSQSIIFFQDKAAQSSRLYADPFLVDFEFARPQTAETQYTFDNNLERNLYRHPDRQGAPTVSFRKMHDIYSLGVVLLEIGLWQTAMSIHQNATKKLKEGVMMNPHAMQNLYIEIARRRLPHHMGPAYRDAVVKCLSCKFTDDDSRLAIIFYEEVVQNIDVTKLQ
jgi:serine/threonine protein kinase